MKSKTRHVDGGVGNRAFIKKCVENMRFEKSRRFDQDIQIQIDKPTQMETPMKSKTRHFDGGGPNPQFEASRI